MENKKKILMVATTPLNNDGITKIELDIIDYCHECITFELACGYDLSDKYIQKLRKLNVIFHRLSNKKKTLSYIWSLYRLVKHGKYNVVYIHGNSALMFLEAISSKFGGAKIVTHCHNTKTNYPIVHHIIKPFFNALVNLKIGCSVYAAKWAYMGKKIRVIPNGVDLMRFRYKEEKRNEIRKTLGWQDKKIVGHIGRMNKQKNHKKLLSIFNKMYNLDDSVRLLIIGDGELREDIIEQINARGLSEFIKIINSTDRPQDYMQAMDIMVLPSLFEGFCLVAVEAQANSLPVLIDNFFPPEASVSDLAFRIDLTESDDVWAKKAIEIMKLGRHDATAQVINNKAEYHVMLDKIMEALLSV